MFYDSVRFIQILNKTCRGPKGPYSQTRLNFLRRCPFNCFSRRGPKGPYPQKVTKM